MQLSEGRRMEVLPGHPTGPPMESGSSKCSENMSLVLPDTTPFHDKRRGQKSKKVLFTLLEEYFSSNFGGMEKVP